MTTRRVHILPESIHPNRVLVVGTGLAGLVAALALAQTGVTVTLAGPDPLAPGAAADQRTTALFGGSIELLRHLDVWPHLVADAAPLTGLRLIDDTGGLLRAPEILFEAREIGAEAFGYNVANANLVAALADRLRVCPGIARISSPVRALTPTAGGIAAHFMDAPDWTGDLVVGADGRNSVCRQVAGIAQRAWSYPQTALATRFCHSRAHAGISTEFHRRAGPLTTVPMAACASSHATSHQSSLVWVETPDEAARLKELDDAAFALELHRRLQGLLGEIGSIGPRVAFPLSGLAAAPLARTRIVLTGEAAHVLPPIGAQGLNLGFRDAAWIAEIVDRAVRAGDDIGGEKALADYVQARRLDVWSRGIAIDLLNRSLIAGFMPLDLARGAGITALAAFPWLRRLAIDGGMGPSGLQPRLLKPRGRFDGRTGRQATI